MNRDELKTRPRGLPPQIQELDGRQVVYPRETSGGTWIAGNSHGNVFALLNWNSPGPTMAGLKLKTRGNLIPSLMSSADPVSAQESFAAFRLAGVHPFRMVAAFRNEKILFEWRWDGQRVNHVQYAWNLKHWFSSSVSDSDAELFRGRTCASAMVRGIAPSLEWLRQLHASHEPEPGPYSICVHRPDAGTVSYTEVECNQWCMSMGHVDGPPCEKAGLEHVLSIALA